MFAGLKRPGSADSVATRCAPANEGSNDENCRRKGGEKVAT